MILTNEQRLEFLKSYNDLRSIVQTIHECQDLWVSDLRKLEELEGLLHTALKFVPQTDSDGRSMHYLDWVLAEDKESEDEDV